MKLGGLDSLKRLSIEAGSVFKMVLYPSDGVVPKGVEDLSRTKYFVVIGKDEDSVLVGSLLINSEVNINLVQAIAPYQHCIYPDDYDFLGEKFRYIDCYRIKELDYRRILDEGAYIGKIGEYDWDAAIRLANASPVNKPMTLKKFGVYINK